jgi:hypothetical protein
VGNVTVFEPVSLSNDFGTEFGRIRPRGTMFALGRMVFLVVVVSRVGVTIFGLNPPPLNEKTL